MKEPILAESVFITATGEIFEASALLDYELNQTPNGGMDEYMVLLFGPPLFPHETSEQQRTRRNYMIPAIFTEYHAPPQTSGAGAHGGTFIPNFKRTTMNSGLLQDMFKLINTGVGGEVGEVDWGNDSEFHVSH